ncbi:carboxymuconolactone decarboxylase [Paracoccus sp. PAR01]|uniref:carboxymuconolactone decarboxylase n=1 Tax=Paracoccus sp. PAR01 TaxID=2769282 RepID=UPI00177F0D62|nr:carboxymuconolactone decarboxylase [Paracoccus sp. PAR01]MBD9527107.1 carboxymuconolactone decarboxylase [Paracoccus sp. PAR01]
MSRISLIDPSSAMGITAEQFSRIRRAFGMVPDMLKAVANSPAAPSSMWGSFAALRSGRRGAKLGEQIADRNNYTYCLATHKGVGRKAGASSVEIAEAQAGRSTDPRIAAPNVDALRVAGLGDEEVAEIISHVALNLFADYLNVAQDVPVNFPGVKLTRAA